MSSVLLQKPNQPWRLLPLVVLLLLLWAFQSSAQGDTLECNMQTPFIPPDFGVSETHWDDAQSFWQNGGHVPANVVDEDTTNYARAHIKKTGYATLRVGISDSSMIYDAGVFTGFYIKSPAFPDGNRDAVTISTYLNGTLQESYSGADLLSEETEGNNDPIHIGFLTSLSFNQVEVTFDTAQGMSHFDVYYAVVQGFCLGEVPECNITTILNTPEYPAFINYTLTGADSASVGNVINAQAAISFSGMDFAKLNHHPNVSGNLYLSIKEQMNDFTAGSFVGFDLENNSLSWMDFIHRVSITTYSNGILHESFTGSELVFGVSATAGGDRQTIGIVTSMVSDEVRLTINQQENVNLGMTKVYGAVFQVVCPGQRMECNSLFAVTNPTQPVVIDASHTGISGPVCVACDVINAENVIDSDPANFATITLPAGVLSSGNIAVQNIATDFTAGTFAGYHIENTALVGANLFNGLTISTYLNGSLQETQTGSEALVSVASDILVNSGEQIAGFITSLPFDEVKLTLSNAGFFNIGTTKIYGLLLDSMCTAPIVCDTTSWLVSPDYPVIIDQSLTGITGVVCALCAVNNGMNIISADPTDYATITMTAGVAASGSIGIVDGLNTYPEGTVTGFAIEDVNNLIEANLFNSLTISTYNNGVFQESFTGSELLDAQVHIEWIPSGESIYNVGVKATMPFDAVRLSVGSIAGINNTINVYGVFVNTDLSVGQGLECDACPNVTIKVLLEGPYDSTTQIMSTQLNEYHVLPGQDPLLSANPGAQLLGIAAPAGQPYDTIPWNWSGREGDAYGDGPGDIPYDEEVVDWMLVSVRANDSLPESEVWKCAGLLYSDGTVVFPEDCACASGLLPTTPYYVVVEHRNHLPVMSEKILMTDNELVFDFTESQSWVYDLGGFELGKGQKPAGSKYVMFAANSEQVSARVDINSSDDAQWLIDNGTIFQYKSGDHNLDGDVNATDEFIWLGNNSTFTLIPFN